MLGVSSGRALKSDLHTLCAKWVDKKDKVLKFAPNKEKPEEEVVYSTRTSGGHYRIGERKRRNFKLLSERKKKNVQLNRQRRQEYSNQNNNNNTPPPTQTNRSSGGVIRKIVIGRDPKDAMAYYVGMRAGGGEVSAIVYDEESMVRYNQSRYLVYLQRGGRTASVEVCQ